MVDADQLTPNERAVLLVLMAEGREIGNPELFERYGFKITKAMRERLQGLKLIEVNSRGGYLHQVSDGGWARGGGDLADDFDVPARPTKVQVAAWKALAKVTGRYLAATGLRPSEFFAPQPRKADIGRQATSDPGVGDDPVALDGWIRRAYWEIAERPHQSVALSDLRRRLDGADPAAVSAALVRMFAEGQINLTPGTDQKRRRKADERAAVRAGGEDKHFVSMAAS